MPTKVYVNKCKWCGVVKESSAPLDKCECCGADEIALTSYEIAGDFPKSYKEQKLEAMAQKKKRNKILLIGGGIILAILALGLAALGLAVFSSL